MINYRLKNAKNLVLDKKLHIFIIIFFEFVGTLLFTYCNLNLLNLKSAAPNIESKIMYGFIDFALSMLMCISYTRQFAGGVYNPAVIIFRMIRRTDRLSIKIGLIYMTSQILGSITGAFIALYLNNITAAPIEGYLPPNIQARHFGTEMVGGFVLTFMVQLVTEKSMTFIDHNRQFYICLPLFYMIAKTYSKSSNCINPAFGISFELTYCVQTNNWQPMAMSYIIIFGPTAGALVSVAMFQLVLRPLFPIKKQIADAIQSNRRSNHKIDILNVEKQHKLKNRWSMNEVIKLEPYALVGDQFDDLFHEIVNENLDDEIKSNSDDDQKQVMYGDFPNPDVESPAILKYNRLKRMKQQAQKELKKMRQKAEQEQLKQNQKRMERFKMSQSLRASLMLESNEASEYMNQQPLFQSLRDSIKIGQPRPDIQNDQI